MSIKAGLYTYLKSVGGVIAIAGDRVFPQVIPDQVYDEASKRPCVVYSVEDTERNETFCATQALRKSRVSIDSYARTYEDAETLADAVRTAVIDYSGYMGSTYVERCFIENDFDVAPDIDPGIFRNRLILGIWHH
jgi:hypothetical protein